MNETYIGIHGYSTHTPKINGIIKFNPESFIVNEIPADIPKDINGKYTILKVKLRNWDTNKFVIFLSKLLHISKKRITYGGTKDKTAITTQYFCINIENKNTIDYFNLNIKDAEVMEVFRSNHMIRLGDLIGNEFIVEIKSDYDNNENINSTVKEIFENGGFPNFFGYQRFGSFRMNTHRIGRLILQGRYEDAVKLYLYDPEFDKEYYRIDFFQSQNVDEALKNFPKYLSFERSILGYIKEHKTYAGAFNVLPKNLAMLFIHSYQSFLYNRILSERMKIIEKLNEIIDGDYFMPVDKYFNPDKNNIMRADKYNQEKLNLLSKENKIRAAIPVIGYNTKLSSGIEGEIEKKIMCSENISFNDFKIKDYPELSSSGDLRIASALPVNFSIIGKNKLQFSLGRGIYATSLLREILKNEDF